MQRQTLHYNGGTSEPLTIVDAHLDLALNAVRHLIDHTRPIVELRSLEIHESQQAMTSIPEFSRGHVALVFATLFAEPADLGFAAIEKTHPEYSDLDAGMSLDCSPLELDTRADFARFAEVVPTEARAGVIGENWLRFLREALP